MNVQNFQENYLGRMDQQCNHCDALFFNCERNAHGQYNRCCKMPGANNFMNVQPLQPMPAFLEPLFTNNDVKSIDFRKYIRRYNSLFSFASTGTTMEDRSPGNALYYRIHGQVYHNISRSVGNVPNPRYAQLYFLDSNQALTERINFNATNSTNITLDAGILSQVHDYVTQFNPYAQSYKMLKEVIDHLQIHQPNDVANVRMYFRQQATTTVSNVHPGQLNFPQTSNEIAAIFMSSDHNDAPPSRDICVRNQSNDGWINIPEISPNCDPLMYTLFFPNGEQGWGVHYPFSILRYYVYRLSVRPNKYSIFFGQKLFQQYIVDAYIKVESTRFRWLSSNQRQVRVESYQGLIDHCNRFAQQNNITCGLPVILPSSFTSGPRYMHQLYQDAISMVRVFGRPDYFITFRCNPGWTEIVECLEQGQKWWDRPDIVSRVFNEKAQEFLDDIVKKEVLGKVLCYVYTVEFQKRGLPHIHLILTVDRVDKLINVQ